jgi:hypothetical protein
MAGRIEFDDLVPKRKAGARIEFDDLMPPGNAAGASLGAFDGIPDMSPRDAQSSDMPYAQQISNVARFMGRGADQAVRAIADGMTFGLADKAAAGMRALTGDASSYADALAQERARPNEAGAAIPGMNTALRTAGGVASGLGLARGGLSLGARALEAGSGFLPRTAGFALDGALAGAADAIGHKDAGSLSEYGSDALHGAKIGAGMGAAVPAAGAMVGGAYRAVAPMFSAAPEGMSRASGNLLRSAVSPRVPEALDRLGPDAVLADASPTFQGLAQGVAAKPGPAADRMVDALTARHSGQATRLAADLDANLGPAISPVELEQAIAARQGATRPLYARAVNEAGPVDTSDALALIGRHLNTAPAGSPEQAALLRARTMMLQHSQEGVPTPVTDARTLLNVRQALDDMIKYGDPAAGLAPGAAGRHGSPIGSIRGALDQALKASVPGLADADLAFSTAARGRDSIEVGRQALSGARDAIWPEDLASNFAGRPLEQQALVRAGARADIASQVGTNRNDLGALLRTLGDEQDFNRAKMATLFGDKPTSNVIDAVNRERAFADTVGRVTQGSRTAPMALASKSIDEATAAPQFVFPKSGAAVGLLAHGGEWLVRKAAGAASGASNDLTRREMANALTASGEQRDALVRGLLADYLRREARGQSVRSMLTNPGISRGLLSLSNDRSATR